MPGSHPASEPPRATVAVFDLDRTITRQGTWTPFLLSVLRQRRGTGRTLRLAKAYILHGIGRTDRRAFKEAALVALLTGLTRDEIGRYTDAFVRRVLETGLRPAAQAVIERHKQAGHRLILATASIDLYAPQIAAKLGIDEVICTRSVWDADGKLTARLAGDNCYGEKKRTAVVNTLASGGERGYIVAYSDHISDLELLTWADRGVAVNPDPHLKAKAREFGLEIEDWNQVPGSASSAN